MKITRSITFDSPSEVLDVMQDAYLNGQPLGYEQGANVCYYMTPATGAESCGRCAVGVILQKAGYGPEDLRNLQIDNHTDLADVLEISDISVETLDHARTVNMMRIAQTLHDSVAKAGCPPELLGSLFRTLREEILLGAADLDQYMAIREKVRRLDPSYVTIN